MTHERDLDQVLDRWMDDGPTVVDDRVIAAAMAEIPTTRQRGRWSSVSDRFQTMMPAAALVGLATVIVVGIAAYQLASREPSFGGPPAPRLVSASELADIILAPDVAPAGMNHDGTYAGRETLTRPIISAEGSAADAYLDQPGFVDGRYSEFSDEQAGVLSWAALFKTVEDAETALSVYVSELQSPEGYGLTSRVHTPLGDDGAFYSDGNDPEFNAQVYLWRVGNLVLAAASYGEYEADELRSVAEQMDERAR